jgi:hypothetical protein
MNKLFYFAIAILLKGLLSMVTTTKALEPYSSVDTLSRRYDLSIRASQIDTQAREHPEIDFTFTDKSGKMMDLEHASVDTRVISRGKLVIWLMDFSPGLFDRVTGYGMHCIQVHYANRWTPVMGMQKLDSGKYWGAIRLEAATGEDFSPLVNIPKPDCIMERSLQFVKWLARENPPGKAALSKPSIEQRLDEQRRRVASVVVFEDGLAKKSEYRRFIIDTTTASDDTRAMHQVITRRMKRLLNDRAADESDVAEIGGKLSKFSYPPQLIVVDGGAPQVAAAQRALDELGVSDVALCGLAKRLEEVWIPRNSDPLILPRTSEGMYLLQRIRDEAHRFAITFHRSRRSKVMLESVLDDIPQMGRARRAALLERFGSVAALRKASLVELALTPGIGQKIAEIIFDHLQLQRESAEVQGVDMQTGEIL